MPKRTSETGSIGQLMIVGFEGTAMSSEVAVLLKRVQPAGVVLFARNIVGVQQTHELLKQCQRLVSTRLFTCVDMEGGLVDRLKKSDCAGTFGCYGIRRARPKAVPQTWPHYR